MAVWHSPAYGKADLAAAFDAGDIAGVAELSAEELAGLMPEPEGMP
jgi:hypothetical protein